MPEETVRKHHERLIQELLTAARNVIGYSDWHQEIGRDDYQIFACLINAVTRLETFEEAHRTIRPKVDKD